MSYQKEQIILVKTFNHYRNQSLIWFVLYEIK